MNKLEDDRHRFMVLRLLRGEFRAQYFIELYLYARDRCDGRETVRDIGDFIAHRNERDKGFITDRVRDAHIVSRYMFPKLSLGKPNGVDELRSLPGNTKEFLAATLN